MRQELAPVLNRRVRVTGWFQTTRNYRENGRAVTAACVGPVEVCGLEIDHVWVRDGVAFYEVNPGDMVEFTARVMGYAGGTKYGLCEPKILNRW